MAMHLLGLTHQKDKKISSLKLMRGTNPFMNTNIRTHNSFHILAQSYNHPVKDDEELNQDMELTM